MEKEFFKGIEVTKESEIFPPTESILVLAIIPKVSVVNISVQILSIGEVMIAFPL